MRRRRIVRRRRGFRRNFPVAGVVANPRRRRVSRRRRLSANPVLGRRRSVRRFRRNPVLGGRSFNILGFNLKDVALAGASVIVAPMVESKVMSLLPANISGTKAGRWGVKIGSAALIGYGAKRFLGPQAGNLALIALGANLVADAVSEFMPLGMYTNSLAYYPGAPRLSGGPGVSTLIPGPGSRSSVEVNTIDRLNPASRF